MLSRTAQQIHRSDVTRAIATKPMPVMRPTTSRIFGTAPICWMASTSALISMVMTSCDFPASKCNARELRWFVERTGRSQVSCCYAGVEVTESNKQKNLVLVVEDEILIRMNSVDIIRDLGFDVIEAVDADEAVSLLEAVPGIEVVFTDIQM